MKDNVEGTPTQVETGIRLPIVGRYHAQCKTGAWPFWTQCEYSVDMYSCVLLFLHSLFFFIYLCLLFVVNILIPDLAVCGEMEKTLKDHFIE